MSEGRFWIAHRNVFGEMTREVRMSIGRFCRINVATWCSSGRWGLRAIAALMLLIPLVAIQAGEGVRAQDEAGPLRIAVLLPFTGDLSDFGQPFLQAAELAVNEINAAGGVNGQPIELVQGDSATSPQQAVEEARRLIELEGVSAIVGTAGS